MYILVTFRSRNHTMAFFQIVRSYGVRAQVVQTPRQVQVSCGTSIRIPYEDLNTALDILKRRKFDTFVGVYEVTDGLIPKVKQIY